MGFSPTPTSQENHLRVLTSDKSYRELIWEGQSPRQLCRGRFGFLSPPTSAGGTPRTPSPMPSPQETVWAPSLVLRSQQNTSGSQPHTKPPITPHLLGECCSESEPGERPAVLLLRLAHAFSLGGGAGITFSGCFSSRPSSSRPHASPSTDFSLSLLRVAAGGTERRAGLGVSPLCTPPIPSPPPTSQPPDPHPTSPHAPHPLNPPTPPIPTPSPKSPYTPHPIPPIIMHPLHPPSHPNPIPYIPHPTPTPPGGTGAGGGARRSCGSALRGLAARP